MSTAISDVEIEYPESDGKPMAETEWHIDAIIRMRSMLKPSICDALKPATMPPPKGLCACKLLTINKIKTIKKRRVKTFIHFYILL